MYLWVSVGGVGEPASYEYSERPFLFPSGHPPSSWWKVGASSWFWNIEKDVNHQKNMVLGPYYKRETNQLRLLMKTDTRSPNSYRWAIAMTTTIVPIQTNVFFKRILTSFRVVIVYVYLHHSIFSLVADCSWYPEKQSFTFLGLPCVHKEMNKSVSKIISS